ncbi:hypothetical protein JQC91_17435 [Jannaschia sp. Os4]|uniref:hypothetical protein n=1 Tax=Jannaschia sp. Os4 TaxID=2807617 RepID=UPI00193AA33B|nr:hypothetical protein [Jannaschia sp. Os4]MBM2578093.1 hypothetical protein [Jannaschia sp. Os4]
MTGRFSLERRAAAALAPPRPAAAVAPEPGPAPPEIVHVDDDRLVLRDGRAGRRRALALAAAALALLPAALVAWAFVTGRAAREAGMLALLDAELDAFGSDYVANEIAAGDRTLPLIWPDRTLTAAEFLRYEFVLTPGGWQAHLPLLLFALAALVLGGVAAWALARRPATGAITFDRARRAVHAGRGAALLVETWDAVRYVQRPWEFGWLLRDEAGTERLASLRLPLDAQGALDVGAGDRLAARISAFMAEGAAAVPDGPTAPPPDAPDGLDARLGRLRR